MDVFLTWCSQQGIKHDSVDIKQTDYGGQGLFLNTSFTSSAPLVHIPANLLITASSLLNDSAPNDKRFSPAFVDILNTVLGPDTLSLEERIKLPGNEKKSLRLFLAYEINYSRTGASTSHQQGSFWQSYVNNLPPVSFFQQNHILFLDADDDTDALFMLLEGTSMASSIRAKHASLRREWQELQTLVPWNLTLEDWMYSDVIFWSRVVDLTTTTDGDNQGDDECTLAMIPFFDFANHRMEPNLRWQLTNKEDGGGLDLVPFDVPITCGQELCLSYGDKSNQELLFLHGFTLDQNPTAGQVTFSLTPFLNPGMDQESELKWQWLQQQDSPPFKPILSMSLQPTTDDTFGHTGWSFESICMMYLAALDHDDGLELTRGMNDKNNIADDLNQLHLSTSSMETATEDDDDDDNNSNKHAVRLRLDGKSLMTWTDLSAAVQTLPHAPVIQLRVVMMLLDASQYHLQQIIAHDDLLKENGHDLSKSPLLSHIVRYRDEERDLLQRSVSKLSLLAEELMDNETVKEYLDKMNSGVEDD
ncbi:hypothetical protein BCR42DRAFT_406145 [Absidia repens]|uniref:SET domain-containing protein n=1 Tax=Absidia repens TaxID=90262 RepID=A0A1X2IUF3_9FUNG|nr:hypothetical protein BCR42DRAFT_406145 [Absidia repens]